MKVRSSNPTVVPTSRNWLVWNWAISIQSSTGSPAGRARRRAISSVISASSHSSNPSLASSTLFWAFSSALPRGTPPGRRANVWKRVLGEKTRASLLGFSAISFVRFGWR